MHPHLSRTLTSVSVMLGQPTPTPAQLVVEAPLVEVEAEVEVEEVVPPLQDLLKPNGVNVAAKATLDPPRALRRTLAMCPTPTTANATERNVK